jgi:hypothetical protein
MNNRQYPIWPRLPLAQRQWPNGPVAQAVVIRHRTQRWQPAHVLPPALPRPVRGEDEPGPARALNQPARHHC